jgi:hypothetical protein
LLAIGVFAGAYWRGAESRAADPSDTQGATTETEVAGLIADLEADDFLLRAQAREKLGTVLRGPERQQLTGLLQDRLDDPALTWEARSTVAALLREIGVRLPTSKPVAACSPAEIERWLLDLQGDRYTLRDAAARQLIARLDLQENVAPIFTALYKRLIDPATTSAVGVQLDPVWKAARARWLASDAATRSLPMASDDQLRAWIELVSTDTTPANARKAAIARLELELHLCDDGQAERVSKLLTAAITALPNAGVDGLGGPPLGPAGVGGPGGAPSPQGLQDLFDLTRPTVAAEIWRSGENVTIQYLVVGKPQWPQAQGARTYTLFDRADEQTAHLANGNSLTPGDYPVGMVFPFQAPPYLMIFRLAYLPTPRQRLLHESLALRPGGQRWFEHCSTTFDRYLAENRELTDLELQTLDEFDSEAVSRFAGPYLERIPDRPLDQDGRLQAAFVASRHGLLCLHLAQRGGPAALPGLLQAIKNNRILPSNTQSPLALARIAALAIATRSPDSPEARAAWPQLLENHEPLDISAAKGAEVGATAAAWLVSRAGESPAAFQLEPCDAAQVTAIGCPPPYRFVGSEGPAQVLKWWENRQPARADTP